MVIHNLPFTLLPIPYFLLTQSNPTPLPPPTSSPRQPSAAGLSKWKISRANPFKAILPFSMSCNKWDVHVTEADNSITGHWSLVIFTALTWTCATSPTPPKPSPPLRPLLLPQPEFAALHLPVSKRLTAFLRPAPNSNASACKWKNTKTA